MSDPFSFPKTAILINHLKQVRMARIFDKYLVKTLENSIKVRI